MTSTIVSARLYSSEADLQSVTNLLNLCDRVDRLDDSYSVEDLQSEFSAPGFDTARDIQLWENAEGQIVVFAEARVGLPSPEDTAVNGNFYTRVHPDYRDSDLEDEVMTWAESRLCEVGQERTLPVEMRSGAPEHYAYLLHMLQRHGMEPARYFLRMGRDLGEQIAEPQLPAGYTLRVVESAEDEERWVDAYNLSFIDHYNFHPRTLESHRHWLKEANYRRERDLIAVAENGEVAAFAFCWIDPADNERNNRRDGWISLLGVRRGHRKLGLGRAMLLAGMHKLKADGMTRTKLGVDAENPSGALQLYESVGFRAEETWVQHLKRLV